MTEIERLNAFVYILAQVMEDINEKNEVLRKDGMEIKNCEVCKKYMIFKVVGTITCQGCGIFKESFIRIPSSGHPICDKCFNYHCEACLKFN